jgi:hypothetical protein
MSTTRSISAISSSMSGCFLTNCGHSGASWRIPKLTGALMRSRPLGFSVVADDVFEHAARSFVERLSAFGQRELARVPVDQPSAEVRLELGDVARDVRRRGVERVGGAREALFRDDGDEHLERAQTVHCCSFVPKS